VYGALSYLAAGSIAEAVWELCQADGSREQPMHDNVSIPPTTSYWIEHLLNQIVREELRAAY
jgi:hypothetical protein